MKYKYFSIYKIMYTFGIINSVLSLIIYSIVSLIPCNKDNIFCPLECKKKYYFDHIFSLFSTFNTNKALLIN